MNTLFKIILVLLIFLAVTSGLTKILLTQQDVEFFGVFGFTDTLLITYGFTQLLSGVLLAIPKTRVVGSLIVSTTFIISAVVLTIAGKFLIAAVTVFMIVLLIITAKRSYNESK